MIADLQKLWQEAFEDSDALLDAFFTTGFSPDRLHCIMENGIPVSVELYEIPTIELELRCLKRGKLRRDTTRCRNHTDIERRRVRLIT